MGFFSFGKKKKQEEGLSAQSGAADKRKASIRRPINLTASASASSSVTNSSGTDGGSPSPSPSQPPQPRRLHTFNGKQHAKQASFAAADSSTPNLHANSFDKDVPPLPPLPNTLGSSNSTSTPTRNSLTVPGPSTMYSNRGVTKQGSSNTLNSVKSNNRRGPHEAPALSPDLMKITKPRSMSYHASSPVRSIWAAQTYGDGTGHPAMPTNGAFGMSGAAVKYASTGSPGMGRGSSYLNANSNMNMGHHAADAEFKEYTRQYEAAISTAHNMAREYHHLPPNKRDKERFEKVGQAFAAAARISREHWSYRCLLEKDRLGSSRPESYGDDVESPHRVAGMRASEGWQYASMLAEAWGSADEISQPLEEMPMPIQRFSSATWSNGSGYLHPGYRPGAMAAYSQPANGEIYVPAPGPGRSRLDSVASYDSFASSHTHSALSHSMGRSRSHQALSSHGHGTGYISSPLLQQSSYPSSGVLEEEAPAQKVIVLKRGRKFSRASSMGTGESLNALAESSKGSSNHAS